MIQKIMKFLSHWPLGLLHFVGLVLGWLVYGLSASYRRKVTEHSQIVFKNNERARKAAVRGSISHTGMALMELPFLWGRSTSQGAQKVVTYHNWELVENALALGKGALLLTPHMGSFETAAQGCSARLPITVLYRPSRHAEVQAIIESSRARHNVALAPTNLAGVKILLKALRRGEAVGILPDQVPSKGEGVWAPMFGRDAYTMTLPSRLFHATGAKIIFTLCLRKPWGRGFDLRFFEGPQVLSLDPQTAAAEINKALEALIMLYPSQYFWGYERYKMPKN
jgi:KDO2-lipid IV(A) lauroyltransferase